MVTSEWMVSKLRVLYWPITGDLIAFTLQIVNNVNTHLREYKYKHTFIYLIKVIPVSTLINTYWSESKIESKNIGFILCHSMKWWHYCWLAMIMMMLMTTLVLLLMTSSGVQAFAIYNLYIRCTTVTIRYSAMFIVLVYMVCTHSC